MKEASSFPDARVDALALALAPGVGARGYYERSQGFGSAAHAFCATVPAADQRRLRDEAVRLAADAERCGATLLLLGDDTYPEPLLHLVDPPPYLCVLGDLAAPGFAGLR